MSLSVAGGGLKFFVETRLQLKADSFVVEMGGSTAEGDIKRLNVRCPFFELLFLWVKTCAEDLGSD